FSSPTLAASYDLFDFGSQSGNLGSIILTGSITGSLLLTSADTWTGSAGDYDFNFSEVSGILSVTSSNIPEPSSYALLLAGLTFAGTVLRRRR
ncbi:MAG TPA: PEP-CTERM sorting domain-containing protein, partial [Rariglobus sp.]